MEKLENMGIREKAGKKIRMLWWDGPVNGHPFQPPAVSRDICHYSTFPGAPGSSLTLSSSSHGASTTFNELELKISKALTGASEPWRGGQTLGRVLT